MFGTYQNIWFCGLAASGKTSVLKLLSKELQNVEFLSDAQEMLEFVERDTKMEHHDKPTSNSFLLKDSEPVYYAVAQLMKKANASKKRKVIELSRGLDDRGIVDFSYKYLFAQLDDSLIKSSLFVYISAPFEARVLRNQKREALRNNTTIFTSFQCPSEAMKRFFMKDDILEAMQNAPVDILFLPNVYSLKHLEDKVKSLFSPGGHLV